MLLDEIDVKSENMSAKFIPKVSLQEYFVDFLGGLVPGILFLVGNIFILFPTLFILGSTFKHDGIKETFIISLKYFFISIKDTPSAFWLVIFIILFFFAYTIGHIFYRHDPKIPDKKSIQRLEKKLRKKGKSDDDIKEELACTSNDDSCQFPYTNYDNYLKKRGLDYLLDFVLWRNERSKSYINLLKTRLMYFHADKCGTIIRNEAHVRLASSTWYVSRFLLFAGLAGFILSTISLIIAIYYSMQFSSLGSALEVHIVPIVLPLLVSLFSIYFYLVIPDFLHYQRLREVFFVLDTYSIAFKENPNLMKVPLDDFMKEVVNKYKIIYTGISRGMMRKRFRKLHL